MMKKVKTVKSDAHIISKLINYQKKIYGGKSIMKIEDIIIECNDCRVRFSPSIYRAKKSMSIHGIINKCKDCEDEV